MLFVWKLHNALSTATYYNLQCKDSELVDEEPYNCYVNETTTPRYSHDGYASTVPLGRAWPTAKRFEFWLKDGQKWNDLRDNIDIKTSYTKLKDIDVQHGPSIQQLYWTPQLEENITTTRKEKLSGERVMDAIAKLDTAILNTDILYTEYELASSQLQ